MLFAAAMLSGRAQEIEEPADPRLWLASTNRPERRCDAAGYYRLHPSEATDAVLRALADMLADARRATMAADGFTGGLPSSPSGEARKALERIGVPAVEPLLSAMSSSDAGQRERAALALGRIRDFRALPRLVQALADPSRQVSLAASDSLVALGTGVLVAVRAHLERSDPSTADRALWVLGELRDAESVPLLLRYVAVDNERARVAAGAALSRLGPQAVQRLLEAWSEANESERIRILHALDRMNVPEARDQVIQTALADRSPALRAAALTCVPAWKDPVGPLLMMCAQRDGSPDIRDQARAAYKLYGAPAAQALAGYLDNDSPVVWQAASIALASMSPDAAPVLFATLRDAKRSRVLKRRTAWVLVHMDNVQAPYEDNLRLWITIEDWHLMNIFSQGIPTPILEALASDHPGHRMGALTTLGLLKPAGAETHLFKALDDEDPDVVATAQHGLAGYGFIHAAQLENAVQRGSLRASRAAARTLAEIEYRPRSQAMGVEYHASRNAVESLMEMGGLVPTHLERRLEKSTLPVETVRLAFDLARVLPVIVPDERFASENVVVRSAFVGSNRAVRLAAMKELEKRPGLLLALALDNEPEISRAAQDALVAMPGNTGELLMACLRSGETRLIELGLHVLGRVDPSHLPAYDSLMGTSDGKLRKLMAAFFAARNHRPADAVQRIAMHVENRDWKKALEEGNTAIPALRQFVLTGERDELAPLLSALAASGNTVFINLLVDVFLVRDERTAELAWPYIAQTADTLQPHLRAMLEEGGLLPAVEAALLMKRLGTQPKPDDPAYHLYLGASGSRREMEDRRDEVAKTFLGELRRPEADRRLRGAIWLMHLQREPEREQLFSMESLVQGYIERLDSGDAQEMIKAAVMLSQLGTNAAPALPALIRALSNNQKMGLRVVSTDAYFSFSSPAEAAAGTLGVIGDAAVLPLLALWRDTNTPSDVRFNVGRAIAVLPDTRLAEAQTILIDRDPRIDVKVEAIRSYARANPAKAALPLLRAASRVQDQLLVSAVMRALGDLGPPAAPQLALALYDPDSTVQEYALSVLADLRDPKSFDAIMRVARGPFAAVRSQAARALGRLGDLRAVDTLLDLLSDRTTLVRWSAAEALAQMGRGAVPGILRKMPTATGETQVHMAALLRNITGGNHGTDAAAWKAWLDQQAPAVP